MNTQENCKTYHSNLGFKKSLSLPKKNLYLVIDTTETISKHIYRVTPSHQQREERSFPYTLPGHIGCYSWDLCSRPNEILNACIYDFGHQRLLKMAPTLWYLQLIEVGSADWKCFEATSIIHWPTALNVPCFRCAFAFVLEWKLLQPFLSQA